MKIEREELEKKLKVVIEKHGTNRNVIEFVSNYFKDTGIASSVAKSILSLRKDLKDLNKNEICILTLALNEILKFADRDIFETIKVELFFSHGDISKALDIKKNNASETEDFNEISVAPNLYLNQVLYNQDLKNKFLDKYTTSTKRFYRYIFQISSELENEFGKDIFEFNSLEIENLLNCYKNGSVEAVSSNVTVLKKYIDFAIEQGLSKINYLNNLTGYDDLKKYVNINMSNKRILSFKQVWDIVDMCYNAQDAICILLPFYGVKGESNEEISNLKKSDVDFINKKLKLTRNNNSIRYIDIDDKLISIIYKAISEEEYAKNNGNINPDLKSSYFNIYENDYVVRAATNKNNLPIQSININARIKRIGRLWGNSYITPTSLWYSGFYHRYLQAKSKKGVLAKDDYLKICDEFGYDKSYSWKIIKKVEGFESLKCS